MPTPQEKLATALEALKAIQDQGRAAIRSDDLSRTDRETLQRNGFLQKVMKGWYIPARPDDRPGDTSPWFSSFWDFCADYANDRFGDQWCLSPEQSILLHVGNRTVPKQLILRTPKGGNKPTDLIHGTSLFDMRGSMPTPDNIKQIERINVYDLSQALTEVTTSFFVQNATDARAALAAIDDSSLLLPKLLDGGHSTIAGRLCGAFRNIGRDETADDLKKTMKAVGYDIVESDPFEDKLEWDLAPQTHSPRTSRLNLMWHSMRETIIERFPSPRATTGSVDDYLKHVEEAYVKDAYHSLSIEGYQVSPDLIEKVRSGKWNPDDDEQDRKHWDALAARGYFQAFEKVKSSVEKVLNGQQPGQVAKKDHADWYRELFLPLVTAGLTNAVHLAGYRQGRVFIKGSRHVPASGDSVRELITKFFELLESETDAGVRIVLGHFVFVYIHPYVDGNGRTARFLMNLMLAAGGYPWTIIPVEKRQEYMQALESASVSQDIQPFTDFIASQVIDAMSGHSSVKIPD